MKVVIIGNGISGVTAARYVRKKSNDEITIISKETKYFFSRTALMYIYMGHMKFEHTQPYEPHFWQKNNINLLQTTITNIDFDKKTLETNDGQTISYDKLILATGSTPNKFGWPGQDLKGVGGLYSYQDLQRIEENSKDLKRAVIVGGGLIGIELAEMFHSRHIPVTFLVREKSFWNIVMPPEESEMINKEILNSGIDLRLETELKEIIDDGQGKACAVITNTGERIDCGFVGLTAGVHPNVGFLKSTALEINRGILVDEYLETNIKDVYAVGDCAEQRTPLPGRRPIEAVWYTGRMMGETVAYNVLGHKIKYVPKTWFNSAKFIDIEYQTYGDVLANPPAEHKSLIWIHEDNTKSIRIVYHATENYIIGFNLMGIRFRYEVCEKWINDKTSVERVLQNLSLANFDPEFYKQYESELVNLYNQKMNTNIQIKSKRKLDQVLNFLRR